MDSAEDIAVDVISRMSKGMTIREAFTAIGHENLWKVSRGTWLPMDWEDTGMEKKVAILTKAIAKAMRSSGMKKEASEILSVAKEVLAGHKTEHSKAWLRKNYPQFNPAPSPSAHKAPDEAQRKLWRDQAEKRRREEGVRPRG